MTGRDLSFALFDNLHLQLVVSVKADSKGIRRHSMHVPGGGERKERKNNLSSPGLFPISTSFLLNKTNNQH